MDHGASGDDGGAGLRRRLGSLRDRGLGAAARFLPPRSGGGAHAAFREHCWILRVALVGAVSASRTPLAFRTARGLCAASRPSSSWPSARSSACAMRLEAGVGESSVSTEFSKRSRGRPGIFWSRRRSARSCVATCLEPLGLKCLK